jgi:hypothetical protein
MPVGEAGRGCCYDFFSYPEQERTGRRGYFGNRGSVTESSQRMKTEPRDDSMKRACAQEAQRPGGGGLDSVSVEFVTRALRRAAAPAANCFPSSNDSPEARTPELPAVQLAPAW